MCGYRKRFLKNVFVNVMFCHFVIFSADLVVSIAAVFHHVQSSVGFINLVVNALVVFAISKWKRKSQLFNSFIVVLHDLLIEKR